MTNFIKAKLARLKLSLAKKDIQGGDEHFRIY